MQGDPLGENFFSKKSLAVPKKNERGDPLVSPGMVCYAEKQEKLFWFSSLGQIVPFGAIIFCRTFKNYFGQFVWIGKKSHYNSRVSLHEAPTKNTCKRKILLNLVIALKTVRCRKIIPLLLIKAITLQVGQLIDRYTSSLQYFLVAV